MHQTETFRRLAEGLGGLDPVALQSFFYWNNPLALKHWTMNVVEIVMIAGALMGLVHAIGVLRRTGRVANLTFWLASIIYLLVAEVPLYFPELIGGDPNKLVFLHNEFTGGFLYDHTPWYIAALYPAMMYPAYVLTEQAGVFARRWGFLLGAVSVGFIHQSFYEIFDHFGPQYGWWIWNADGFGAFLASVPMSSVLGFATLGPFAHTLLVRLLAAPYDARLARKGASPNALVVGLLCIVIGFGTLILLGALLPESYYAALPRFPSVAAQLTIALAIIAAFGLVTLLALSRSRGQAEAAAPSRYPLNFLIGYLVVFAGLWLYALPEILAASGGVSPRGTPVGSVPYVVVCFLCCLFIIGLGRTRPGVAQGPARQAAAA